MNKTLKLTLLTFGLLSLVACDGSPNNSTSGGGTSTSFYSISVRVNGLETSEAISFSSSGKRLDLSFAKASGSFADKVKKGNAYSVTISNKPITKDCVLSSNSTSRSITSDITVSASCTANNKPVTPPVIPPTNVDQVLYDAGKLYYMSECAACHRSGTDDQTYVFSSSDLVASMASANAFLIAADMHAIGPMLNFMGRFNAVPSQRLIELKEYLKFAPKATIGSAAVPVQ